MKHKVDLVCIQETKKESFDKLICQSMWGDSYVSWDFVPSIQASGGSLCLWNNSDFQVERRVKVGSSSEWSKEQDKAFENALAIHPEDASDRWEKIMADVPGKTLEEIKHHYELLIESGCVPLASYNSSPEGSTSHASDEGAGKKGGHSWNSNNESNHGTKASRSDQERRKGIAWTEDEHKFDHHPYYTQISTRPCGSTIMGITAYLEQMVEASDLISLETTVHFAIST
ncbi:Transcription factor SRM1 [Glycine max]|nr:Transcription factor SRM1 [Glycine max]